MRKIDNIGELYGMVYELLVEIECPICHSICISTMTNAEMILIFGCLNCANIEKSLLTEMNIPTIEILSEEIIAECIND
jgi:hypothetical protein